MKPLGSPLTHYWLLKGMVRRTGADAVSAFEDGALSPEDWAGLVEACRGCTDPEACQRLLSRIAEEDEEGAAAPSYCLNAEKLATLPRVDEEERL